MDELKTGPTKVEEMGKKGEQPEMTIFSGETRVIIIGIEKG
jgi:hypothetical protein